MKNIENLAQTLDGLTARLQKCRKPTPRRNLLRSAVINRRNPQIEVIGLVEVDGASCHGCACCHLGSCAATFETKCTEWKRNGKYFQYRKIKTQN